MDRLLAGWNGSYVYTVMIDRGQGYMGSTGNATGPHLHFEVHRDGNLVNPLSLLP